VNSKLRALNCAENGCVIGWIDVQQTMCDNGNLTGKQISAHSSAGTATPIQ
jgi:hypothetical protein